jgi:hypothetical protein
VLRRSRSRPIDEHVPCHARSGVSLALARPNPQSVEHAFRSAENERLTGPSPIGESKRDRRRLGRAEAAAGGGASSRRAVEQSSSLRDRARRVTEGPAGLATAEHPPVPRLRDLPANRSTWNAGASHRVCFRVAARVAWDRLL